MFHTFKGLNSLLLFVALPLSVAWPQQARVFPEGIYMKSQNSPDPKAGGGGSFPCKLAMGIAWAWTSDSLHRPPVKSPTYSMKLGMQRSL